MRKMLLLWLLMSAPLAHGAEGTAAYGLTSFVGVWDCQAFINPELSIYFTFTAEKLSDSYLAVDYLQVKTDAAQPYQSKGIWGINSFNGQYFRQVFTNANGTDLGHSSGFQGDTMVWEGNSQFQGKPTEYQSTFVMLDSHHYKTSFRQRVLQPAGEWADGEKLECIKR